MWCCVGDMLCAVVFGCVVPCVVIMVVFGCVRGAVCVSGWVCGIVVE